MSHKEVYLREMIKRWQLRHHGEYPPDTNALIQAQNEYLLENGHEAFCSLVREVTMEVYKIVIELPIRGILKTETTRKERKKPRWVKCHK